MASAAPKRGNNIVVRAEPYIHKIEGIEADIESEKGRFMAYCKTRRKLIKDAIKAAKDEDVPPPVLKGIVARRKFDRKIANIPTDFDIDEAAAYRELETAFGPLGKAAAKAAGYGDKGEPSADERKAAEHEAGLQTVGRGKTPGEMMSQPGGPLASS